MDSVDLLLNVLLSDSLLLLSCLYGAKHPVDVLQIFSDLDRLVGYEALAMHLVTLCRIFRESRVKVGVLREDDSARSLVGGLQNRLVIFNQLPTPFLLRVNCELSVEV